MGMRTMDGYSCTFEERLRSRSQADYPPPFYAAFPTGKLAAFCYVVRGRVPTCIKVAEVLTFDRK